MKSKDHLVFGLLIVIIVVAIILALTSKNSEEGEPIEPTAQEEAVVVDAESGFIATKSSVNWRASKKVIKEWVDTGTIRPLSATLDLSDEGVLEGGSVVIDMTSIEVIDTGRGTDFEQLATHVSSDAFFDVEKYPTASFMITDVAVNEMTDTLEYLVTGDMTIKETTQSVTFPLALTTQEDIHRVTGSVDIDRSVFDVRFGSDKFFDNLGDNVIDDIFTITFDLAFAGQ